MIPPPPNDTPPPTPSSPNMQLEMDVRPVGELHSIQFKVVADLIGGTYPNIPSHVGASMTSVEDMNKSRQEDSCDSVGLFT
jgi:hypothetical protein